LIAAVRSEARNLMASMLHGSFVEFPKGGGSANTIKNDLYLTQQFRGPASGINVVEKKDGALPDYDEQGIALLKRFFLRLAGKASFMARPNEEIHVSIASFLEHQKKDIERASYIQNEQREQVMNKGEDQRNSFINSMFTKSFVEKSIVTLGLSPPPAGLSFLEDGVRVQVASEPTADETALRHAKGSFMQTDVRVQAGSRHWPKPSELVSFLQKNADLADALKVAQANVAAAKAYQSAAGSSAGAGGVSFIQGPAEDFMKRLTAHQSGSPRQTQAPMVWLRQ